MDDKRKREIIKRKKEKELILDLERKTTATENLNVLPTDEQLAEPKKNSKKQWITMLILLIVIGVSIYFVVSLTNSFTEGDAKSLGDLIKDANWAYFFIGLAVIFSALILDSLRFFIITKSMSSNIKYHTTLKTSVIGKYYDAITPFAVGGQPMQMYYLHKKGLSGGHSSAVVLLKHGITMFSALFVSFFMMLFNSKALNNIDNGNLLQIFGWIGWGLSSITPIGILLFALMPNMLSKILGFFVNLGAKMKIVKDPEKKQQGALKVASDYKNAFKMLGKKPFHLVGLIIVSTLEPIFALSFPYFVLMAFAENQVIGSGFATMMTIMTLTMFAQYSVTFVPTPGNAGAIETVFALAFKYLAEAVLFWVVFTWRFFSFYIYVLVGLVISIVDFIRKLRKNRLAKKRTEIQ